MRAAVVDQPELGEDRAHVRHHGALREAKGGGDRTVGVTLGDEAEHLAFTRGERVDGLGRALADQGPDDLRVDGTSAVRYATQGVLELGQVQDAVLEQVAKPWRPDQLATLAALDVLRQQQDAHIWAVAAD